MPIQENEYLKKEQDSIMSKYKKPAMSYASVDPFSDGVDMKHGEDVAEPTQEDLDWVANEMAPKPEISEEAKAEMTGRGLAQHHRDDLISAGIPALAGIIAGVPEAGFKAGADNLATSMKWRREDAKAENARLMALWKAKSKEGSSGTKKKVRFEDGTAGYFWDGDYYDSATHKITSKKLDPGYEIKKQDKLDKIQADNITKINKEWAAEHGKIQSTISDMSLAISQLGKGTLNKKVALMSIVKKIEGRMTDEDRNFYREDISLYKKFHERLAEQKTNDISPRLIKEAKMLLGDSLDRAYSGFERRKKQFIHRRDNPLDYIDSATLPKKPVIKYKKTESKENKIWGKDKYGNKMWVLPEHLEAAVEEGFERD